jgi:hypothetical protein
MAGIEGLHHVTAIAGEPQVNIDFANRWNRKKITKKGPHGSWARNHMGNPSL